MTTQARINHTLLEERLCLLMRNSGKTSNEDLVGATKAVMLEYGLQPKLESAPGKLGIIAASDHHDFQVTRTQTGTYFAKYERQNGKPSDITWEIDISSPLLCKYGVFRYSC